MCLCRGALEGPGPRLTTGRQPFDRVGTFDVTGTPLRGPLTGRWPYRLLWRRSSSPGRAAGWDSVVSLPPQIRCVGEPSPVPTVERRTGYHYGAVVAAVDSSRAWRVEAVCCRSCRVRVQYVRCHSADADAAEFECLTAVGIGGEISIESGRHCCVCHGRLDWLRQLPTSVGGAD